MSRGASDEFDVLAGLVASTSKALKDLETRVTLFNSSVTKLCTDGEKLALSVATLMGPLGVGRNGDFAAVKSGKAEHDARVAALQVRVKAAESDLRRLTGLVEDRRRLGSARFAIAIQVGRWFQTLFH